MRDDTPAATHQPAAAGCDHPSAGQTPPALPVALRARVAPSFAYSVVFTRDLLNSFALDLAGVFGRAETPLHLLPVVDDGLLAGGFLPRLQRGLAELSGATGLRIFAPHIVPGGEVAKNDPAHLAAVYDALQRADLCRHSYVMALGGGAVLDVAGYAAATAHRGVRLVRVPSTVLAQADSGVGVKNGINAFGRKNFLGTFAPPHAVVCDQALLRTLSDRDWRAGMSEAVKVAMIKDAAFFAWLEEHAAALVARDEDAMQQLIGRSAALHVAHIANAGDPFEQGSARPLDFGHWAAHKLEQMTRYALRHGEAVAIGMALDTEYAARTGLIDEPAARRLPDLLRALGLPTTLPASIDPQELLAGLAEFRAHLGGRLCITLPTAVGSATEVHTIDQSVMARGLRPLTPDPSPLTPHP